MIKSIGVATSEKTNIYLLAGFLGSGKTTLLNRILSWETDLSDTVVLVNEFGKIGIDGAIIRSKSGGRDVIELTSGCICCTLTDELIDSLVDIWKRFRPKKILLEATGVAEPESIIEIIRSKPLRDLMRIEKTITVLGIRYWIGREAYGPFFMSQVEQADLIMLNKIDTVPKDRLQEAVSDLQAAVPNCTIVPTLHCAVDPEIIWNRSSNIRLGNFYASLPSSAIDLTTDKGKASDKDKITYSTFDFVSERPIDEASFDGFLKNLPWQLFRIKGPVKFQNQVKLLNYVSGQIDWQEWKEPDHTRLALIGWDINTDEIRRKLEECVAE
ncbi:MAG: GTP-binding protein [Proteobacteria bacterium]|nr:GTP-binding protein [Pseudomonadota bacterium]MBU1712399.1 GTP-binding protein [Pseudomonadota bacterium]